MSTEALAVVPAAVQQERTILGMLLSPGNEAAFGQCESLLPHMLQLDSHRHIFEAAQAVFAAGHEVHVGTVQAELERRRQFSRIGGTDYLWSLTEGLPFNQDIGHYVREVRDRWQRREAQRVAQSLGEAAADLSQPVGETLSVSVDRLMASLSEQARTDESSFAVISARALHAVIERSQQPEEQRRGLTYGHADLDALTFGAFPTETTVVGARSGVGKSSLLLQAVRANVMAGVPCVLFSLEMSAAKCADKLLALESGVPYWKIREANLSREDRRLLQDAQARFDGAAPLTVHAVGGMPLTQVAALARVAIRRDGAGLFGIDYLQIVNAPGRDDRERVGRASRTFTDLAKNEGVHGILLSQLRKPTSSSGNASRPEAADLRESGTIENDASVIVLLHRRWIEASSKWDTAGKIYVPKMRDGEQGSFLTGFDRNSVSFVPDPTVVDWE